MKEKGEGMMTTAREEEEFFIVVSSAAVLEYISGRTGSHLLCNTLRLLHTITKLLQQG